jgi:hypothetical protein
MFINPDLSGQLARDRQHRVRGWVGRAAAMLRRPARIPARSAITRPVS